MSCRAVVQLEPARSFSQQLANPSEWDDFEPYVIERNERMQRLQVVASFYAKLQCEWGEDARAFRADIEERVSKDPQAGNIRHVPVVGPYRFEEDTCGESGVRRIFGDRWSVTSTGALQLTG
jgi:hypothetical protein